jgi:ABC-type multidrug transport system fused ATPase/permease subunit
VKPGTSTAIVGESGSGKSTCLKLLYRFYDIEEGSIALDGNDLRDLKLETFRKYMAIVPQDTILFNSSILYNLHYANPDATLEEVYEACRAASIHDKILSFPDGYETKVGERGLRLSGGEKQRVRLSLMFFDVTLLIQLGCDCPGHLEKATGHITG